MATVLGLALLVSAEAFAGLRWEQRRVEPGVRPSATAVEAGFAFRNVGDSPVTITGVRTSCGCTAAALEQKTYAPGESGRIDVRFRFGARTGLQRKTVTVTTDDTNQPRTTLVLQVEIPKVLEIRPRFVYWREPGEKRVHVRVLHDAVESLSMELPEDAAFEAELQTPTEDEPRFVLSVRPVGPVESVHQQLTLEGRCRVPCVRTEALVLEVFVEGCYSC
jgi:hypothetical protein